MKILTIIGFIISLVIVILSLINHQFDDGWFACMLLWMTSYCNETRIDYLEKKLKDYLL